MGGRNSGNWWRWDKRDTTGETIGLDVRYLARRGFLRPGFYRLYWSVGEKPAGDIGLRVTDDDPRPGKITLEYRTRRGEGDWQSVTQYVALDWTPCHYGGHRPWLCCTTCGKRMAILYSGGAGFYCRKCLGLVYESQRESSGDRAVERARRIRKRLGGSTNMTELFPDRPPRMHRRTYERLRREHDAAEFLHELDFIAGMRRLGTRFGVPLDVPQADNLDALLDAMLGGQPGWEQVD